MKLFQIALLCLASTSAMELSSKAEQSSLAQLTKMQKAMDRQEQSMGGSLGCCGPEIPYKTEKNADGSTTEYFKRRGGKKVTTWPNGDKRTDYPSGDWFRKNADGSSIQYDADFNETEEKDAEGNETTTYDDGSKYIEYANGKFEEYNAKGELVDSGDLTKFVPCEDCDGWAEDMTGDGAMWGNTEDMSGNTDDRTNNNDGNCPYCVDVDCADGNCSGGNCAGGNCAGGNCAGGNCAGGNCANCTYGF